MSKVHLSLVALTVLAIATPSHPVERSSRNLPNVSLSLAARSKENGKTGRAFTIFYLFCGLGECWLDTMSLNNCDTIVLQGEASFSPDTIRYSTREGDLKVTRSGTLLIVEALQDSHAFMTLRFGLGTDLRSVTTFTGVVIPNVDGLPPDQARHFPAAIELVPFVGDFVKAELDCPPRVQGVHPTK